MPWTAEDSAAHNSRVKGSPKLQKLWAGTANGTLAHELAKGTAQTEAEGIAIATANKAVAKKPKKVRSEPRGASTRPQPPVRTVTDAPPVARSGTRESSAGDLRLRLSPLSPATLDDRTHTVRAVLATEDACLSRDLHPARAFWRST